MFLLIGLFLVWNRLHLCFVVFQPFQLTHLLHRILQSVSFSEWVSDSGISSRVVSLLDILFFTFFGLHVVRRNRDGDSKILYIH